MTILHTGLRFSLPYLQKGEDKILKTLQLIQFKHSLYLKLVLLKKKISFALNRPHSNIPHCWPNSQPGPSFISSVVDQSVKTN